MRDVLQQSHLQLRQYSFKKPSDSGFTNASRLVTGFPLTIFVTALSTLFMLNVYGMSGTFTPVQARDEVIEGELFELKRVMFALFLRSSDGVQSGAFISTDSK